MGELLAAFAAFAIVILIAVVLVVIAIYVVIAIFLSKFNKLANGKGTVLAWLPICNFYLLGKLTFNKIFGWILAVCSVVVPILTSTITTTVNGETTIHTLLPAGVGSALSGIYTIAIIIILICAIVRYNDLKQGKQYQESQTFRNKKPMMRMPSQGPAEIEPQPIQQPAPIVTPEPQPVVQPEQNKQ